MEVSSLIGKRFSRSKHGLAPWTKVIHKAMMRTKLVDIPGYGSFHRPTIYVMDENDETFELDEIVLRD